LLSASTALYTLTLKKLKPGKQLIKNRLKIVFSDGLIIL
jgi:hypothetical protein